MRIDPKRCVECANCVAICPMGAISIDPSTRRAVVDEDECVECYACYRGMSMEALNPTLVRLIRRTFALFRFRFDPEPDVCPTSAITPQELEWPRAVRRVFSDVLLTHESTGILGRGTEEVKTNDVTGRLGPCHAGFVVELGRPSVGARFHDIQRVAMALAQAGAVFEEKNPVTDLMTDSAQGLINPEVLDVKVMSAIIEFRVSMEEVGATLEVLGRVAEEIDTVMAVGVAARCDEAGENPLEEILR
ncbi:MAG: 4Fe-4S binding protein, partial [Gemmatimonadetes bacterium]|nr:4Fe-4S binding protein [Gemmatimonadota bacterium]